MHGIGSEDQIGRSLKYLEGFDRLLKQLPEDQLRRTFNALGVRLEIRFAPNPDPRSRRQRVPVGGTLTFGAAGIGGNDSPPAGAEGGTSNGDWLGCGGSYCTQCSSVPALVMMLLRTRLSTFLWQEVEARPHRHRRDDISHPHGAIGRD